MFYRSPALHKNKGFIRKRTTGLQVSHASYVEPLMKFFHDSIDFERVMEINKQDLVLADDYSVYHVFSCLKSGNDSTGTLPLVDMQTSLSKNFNVKFSYKEIKLAMIRQFPITSSHKVENLRY